MTSLRRIAGRPTWLLSRANARAQAILRDALDAEGVGGYHVRLLAALDEHGAASQADLGRLTGIDRSDVVATLNELVAAGLASRRPDPSDGRRNTVTITAAGTTAIDRLDAVLTHVQDVVLAPLTDRERTTFVRLLAKLG